MAKRFTIVGGPSKWDLILALFDTREDLDPNRVRQNGRLVVFEIADDKGGRWRGDVHIHAVKKAQDYSFQDSDWELEGRCVFPTRSPLGERFINWRLFIAHFNTQTREGWLELIKES